MLLKETNRVFSRIIFQEIRNPTFRPRQRDFHRAHILAQSVANPRNNIFLNHKKTQRSIVYLMRWNSTVSSQLNDRTTQVTPQNSALQENYNLENKSQTATADVPVPDQMTNISATPINQTTMAEPTLMENAARTATSSVPDPSLLNASTVQDASIVENVAEATTVVSGRLKDYVIPPRPSIPVNDHVVESVQTNDLLSEMEPSLLSQGLGGWSPSGLIQTALEALHISCDIPWWISIVIGTCVVRFLMFPLVILAQRNAARMNNYLPQMQVLQVKMSEARKAGNPVLAAKYAQELMMFMREKNLNPLKNMMVPLAQAPVFISFFFALRGMANLPLESMKTGGAFWFVNLTVPDPLYILPLLTSLSLYLTVEMGVDSGMRTDNMQMMRYVLRAMPIIIFPFTMNFPAAVLCYWTTTNFLSLGQVAILRYGPLRSYFNIEPLVKHDPSSLPIPTKGFVEGFKDSYSNTKIVRELEERIRSDEMQFRKAGIGPIQKTYPFDPTKQTASRPPVAAAKSRDSE